MKTLRSTHPIFVVAAASVTALSLTGIAVLGGWLPMKREFARIQPPVAQINAAPNATTGARVSSPRAVEPPRVRAHPTVGDAPRNADITVVPTNENGIPVERSRSRSICTICGTVESVREIAQTGENSWIGGVAGGLLGGLLGNQIGHGNGKALATVAGIVGGAYAGREIEKHARGEHQGQITVRFDDGRTQTFTGQKSQAWRIGDRVRLHDGRIQAEAV